MRSSTNHRTEPSSIEPVLKQNTQANLNKNLSNNVNVNEPISSHSQPPHKNVSRSTVLSPISPTTEKTPKETITTSGTSEQNPSFQRATPLITNPQPIYPESAKRRQQQGAVTVTVAINKQGEVSQLSVFHSSGFKVLDQNILQTVARWRFKAALQNGLPADDLITLSFDFYINP
jgi:protein TonB